eukprot:982751-Karenia_brevis.AAC.1
MCGKFLVLLDGDFNFLADGDMRFHLDGKKIPTSNSSLHRDGVARWQQVLGRLVELAQSLPTCYDPKEK